MEWVVFGEIGDAWQGLGDIWGHGVMEREDSAIVSFVISDVRGDHDRKDKASLYKMRQSFYRVLY